MVRFGLGYGDALDMTLPTLWAMAVAGGEKTLVGMAEAARRASIAM